MLRDSARGEECTVQIVGVCNYQSETTVLAHLPDESKGMGKKADDFSACYSCSACHDALDRRVRSGALESECEWYMRRAMTRTIRRLYEKNLITIKGAK